MQCPKCQAQISNENINIQANIAKCNICHHVFRISDYLDRHKHPDRPFNPNQPPKGAWYRHDMNTVVIGATTRHTIAFFLVPFMLIWSGGSLGGIYGTQLVQQQFNLIQSLFGIPFILGSILFWALTFMAIFGKVEIRIDRQGGEVFTGIGRVGRKKKFLWREIKNIYAYDLPARHNRNRSSRICIDGKDKINIGAELTSARQEFILQALKRMQAQYK